MVENPTRSQILNEFEDRALAHARSSQDKSTLKVLEKAFRDPGEVRLLAGGRGKPGLFPASATGRAQAERCLSGDRPWLRVTREVDGHRFVTIADGGIAFLAEHVTPDARRELMDGTRVPPARAAAMLRACIGLADRRYEAVVGQVRETLQEHHQTVDDLRSAIAGFADRVASATREVQAELDSLRHETAELRNRLAAITLPEAEPDGGLEAPELPEPTPDAPAFFAPVAADDESFAQAHRLAEEMVLAWEEARGEARAALEAALLNAGVETIGDVGQVVRCDPTLHEGGSSGAAVEVTVPGWLLTGRRHRHILAKAKVRPAEPRTEDPAL
jgi:uncharacterized protein YukE